MGMGRFITVEICPGLLILRLTKTTTLLIADSVEEIGD